MPRLEHLSDTSRTRRTRMDHGTGQERPHLEEPEQSPSAPCRSASPDFLLQELLLAYRRPKNGQAGSWMARWQDKAIGADKQLRLGDADDYTEADGRQILTYRQAQEKAEEWCKEQARSMPGAIGRDHPCGPYTVANAWDDYIKEAERRA